VRSPPWRTPACGRIAIAEIARGTPAAVAGDMDLVERASGLMLGLAVGDALGLPREGMAPERAVRRFGRTLRHAFWFGRGAVSDDTEHAWMSAQAILATAGDPDRFARSLAWRLRGWIAALPPGVGWATLRACVRLWLGFPPSRSGRPSAGNGPLMRAPVIGFATRDDTRRAALVLASTRMTHTHPLALEGAHAVADLAAAARDGVSAPAALLATARRPLRDPIWAEELAAVEDVLARDVEPHTWARARGRARGITGYVVDTLPAVLVAWLRDPPDYVGTVTTAIALGGDTDTVAAIAGALAGTAGGRRAIPEPWIDGLVDWPLTPRRLVAVAERLTAHLDGATAEPVPIRGRALLPLRNLAMLATAVAHVLRRWVP